MITTTTPSAPTPEVGAGGGAAAAAAPSAPVDATLRERKKLRTRQLLHSVAMDLVLERGLAGVTVEEICSVADVSTRTFFNYYPSKAAAAMGLTAPEVRPEVLERFHARSGEKNLVPDLCRVIAETIELAPDRQQLKKLVEARPELVPTVHAWMSEIREKIVAAVAARIGDDTAHLAVALVMSAFMVAVHTKSISTHDELAETLVETVGRMVELAGR